MNKKTMKVRTWMNNQYVDIVADDGDLSVTIHLDPTTARELAAEMLIKAEMVESYLRQKDEGKRLKENCSDEYLCHCPPGRFCQREILPQ